MINHYISTSIPLLYYKHLSTPIYDSRLTKDVVNLHAYGTSSLRTIYSCYSTPILSLYKPTLLYSHAKNTSYSLSLTLFHGCLHTSNLTYSQDSILLNIYTLCTDQFAFTMSLCISDITLQYSQYTHSQASIYHC